MDSLEGILRRVQIFSGVDFFRKPAEVCRAYRSHEHKCEQKTSEVVKGFGDQNGHYLLSSGGKSNHIISAFEWETHDVLKKNCVRQPRVYTN